MSFRNLISCLVISIFFGPLFSQNAYFFKHLTTRDGLSQSSILSIAQDKQGFMWFGTMDGLNRFDGYSVKVHRKKFKTTSSLQNNRINDLKVDEDGNIWIAHDQGIDKLNPLTDCFTNFKQPQNVLQIEFVNRDQLVACTLNGLFFLDLKSGQTSPLKSKSHVPGMLKKVGHNLLFFQGNQIYRLQGRQLNHWLTLPDVNAEVVDLLEVKSDYFILTKHQLIRYDSTTRTFHGLTDELKSKLKGKLPFFNTMLKLSIPQIWIGSNNGIIIYDLKDQTFQEITTDLPSNLSSKNIHKLFEDATGGLWIGTFDSGLNYLDIQHPTFLNILPIMSGQKILSDRLVYALLPEPGNKIWVGTDDGLDWLNLADHSVTHFKQKVTFSSNRIRVLVKDSRGNLWIGTYDGINYLNPANQSVQVFRPYEQAEQNIVLDLLFIDLDHLLVGLKNSGLFVFDVTNGRFSGPARILRGERSITASDLFVTDLKKDAQGNIYVATYGDGLFYYRADQNALQPVFNTDGTDFEKCRYLYCVFPETPDKIWLGTYGQGLYLYKKGADALTGLSMKNGLPNNVVYGILKSAENNYWVSTNKGLCLVKLEDSKNPKLTVQRIFDFSDGLPDNEFNFGAYYQTDEGWLYFGTVNGFVYFDPRQIKLNKMPPKVMITGIKVNHQPLTQLFSAKERQQIWEKKQLHLKNHQNTVEISFTALHFVNPLKNRFAYRLEGFEEQWNYTDARHRKVVYRRLKGGDYRFLVKAANPNGIWSREIAALQLHIDRAIWEQAWFKVFLILMIIASGYIGHHFRTLRIRERNKLLNEFNRKLKREIEEKKRMMVSLNETLEKFQTIFENVPVGVFYMDRKANITEVNENFVKILGSSYDKLLGLNLLTDINDEKLKEAVKNAMQGETGYYEGEYTTITSNKTLPVRAIIRGIHSIEEDIVGAVGIVEDLSGAKLEKLKESVIRNISQAVITTEDMGRFYQIFGKELSKIIDTQNLFIALYDAKQEVFTFPLMKDEKDAFKSVPARGTLSHHVIQQGKPCLFREREIQALIEQKVINQVGTLAKCWLGIPLRIENQIIGVLVVQDYQREDAFTPETLKFLEVISSSLAASIHQKQTRQILSLLTKGIAQSSLNLLIADRHGDIIYSNLYSKDSIFQNSLNLKDILKHHLEGDSAFIDESISKGQKWNGEVMRKFSENNVRWEYLSINPVIEHKQVTHFVVVIEDITHAKKLQNQLHQTQKIESIGTLAGGIAHDFNNLLTVINGHAEIALLKLNQNKKVHSDIVSILHAGKRAANLTRQLLAFSRKQIFKAQLLNVNDVIQSMEKMLRRLIGEDIIIEIELSPTIPMIKADPSQLEQVLLNLIVNARDAIKEQEKLSKKQLKLITIKTEKVFVEETEIIGEDLEIGYYVQVSVIDSGIGMDDATRQKVFEPFFTTKEVGKGTGLGLSTVYGIVKQNQGFIKVESQPGKGSRFSVFWPVAQEIEVKAPSRDEEQDVASGQGKVLVVEDDESVREFMRDILKQFGYTVFCATNGQEGAEQIKKIKDKLDLVITDMIMPEMNGNELAEIIHIHHPESKILFTSGYAETHIIQDELNHDGTSFLHKPFTIVEFTQAVKKLLAN